MKKKIDWDKVWKSFQHWFDYHAKDYSWETQENSIAFGRAWSCRYRLPQQFLQIGHRRLTPPTEDRMLADGWAVSKNNVYSESTKTDIEPAQSVECT